MDIEQVDACYFRARELAKRIVEYQNAKDRENFLRTRFNRYSTPFPGKTAVADVCQDEALDYETTHFLLKELGRQGSASLASAGLEWLLESSGRPQVTTEYFNAVINCCAVSFQADVALKLLQDMVTLGLRPNITSYNMAIASCSHGGHITKAFELVDEMQKGGLAPNTFTALMLIQCCNFKKKGSYQYSIRAYKMLTEFQIAPPPAAVEALLEVCVVAMLKAQDLQEATAVFAALRELKLAGSTKIFNALMWAHAKCGEWRAALQLFDLMTREGVAADTSSYNALIKACVVGGELSAALEVFERMVEGPEGQGPVEADVDTFNMLIQACHQAGLLEKALEVMAWLKGSGIEFNVKTYEELINTVEIAQLWDDKAAAQALSSSLAIFPYQLRPAPFDGMRMLYLEHMEANEAEEALGREKLGSTWVPSSMRGPPRASKAPLGQGIINNVGADSEARGSVQDHHAYAPPTPLMFSRMPSMPGVGTPSRDPASGKLRLPSPIARELLATPPLHATGPLPDLTLGAAAGGAAPLNSPVMPPGFVRRSGPGAGRGPTLLGPPGAAGAAMRAPLSVAQ